MNTNRAVLILVVFAFFTSLLPVAKADKLVSLDATAGILTVEGNNGLKAYRTKSSTTVTMNGAASTLATLKPGMKVTLVLADGNNIASIAAVGNALPAPAANKIGTVRPPLNGTRKILIKAVVDGHEVFYLKGGKMWLEHRGWDKVKQLTVNSIPWEPAWTGNRSDDFVAFQPALATLEKVQVKVAQSAGRSKVILVEQPTGKNEHTLKLRVDDGAGGADKYEFRIEW